MGPYKYQRLEAGQIRLLTLLPDEFDGRIRVIMSNVHQITGEPDTGRTISGRLEVLANSVPPGWNVWETLDGDILFENEETEETTWTHPRGDCATPSYSRHDSRGANGSTCEPQYEALSYTWGSESAAFEIEASTGAGPGACSAGSEGTILIRENLRQALLHLRHADRPRTLWIDALCINQDDVNERNEQVRHMDTIYRMASRVVIWLGTESINSDVAMRTLQHLGEQLEWTVDDYRLRHPDAIHPDWWRARTKLPYDDAVWHSLQDLVDRPWFDRLWIWQEVQLSNRYSFVKCGSYEVSLSIFRRALRRLYAAIQDMPVRLRNRIRYVDNLVNHWHRSGLSFPNWLAITAKAQCGNPRDKIYGLLGVAPSAYTRDLVPSYASSVSEVYESAVLSHLRISGSLSLLCQCDLGDRNIETPTWVPDWSARRRAPMLVGSGFSSSGQSLATASYEAPRTLQALGILCATVSTCTSIGRDTLEHIVADIPEWAPAELETGLYVNGEPLLDAFAATLCGDEISERTQGHFDPSMEEARQTVMACIESPQSTIKIPASSLFALTIVRWVPGRSYVTTEEGYIGLAPAASRPGKLPLTSFRTLIILIFLGDKIYVFPGCPMPIVLRKQSTGFQVVGSGYFHGLMHSEGVLGQLPAPWTYRLARTESMWLVEQFYNTDTGEQTSDDPRLGEMPEGWEIINQPSVLNRRAVATKFRNTATGLLVDGDPRLLPEALKQRGVCLSSISLI